MTTHLPTLGRLRVQRSTAVAEFPILVMVSIGVPYLRRVTIIVLGRLRPNPTTVLIENPLRIR